MTRLMTRVLLLITVVAVLALLGCGGHSSGGPSAGHQTVAPEGYGTVEFTIDWPEEVNPAYLPAEMNRVVIFVSAENMSQPRAFIANRPDTGGSSTFTVDGIPSGHRRLFSAQARNVPNPGSQSTIDDPTHSQLVEGDILASGTAGPVDVLPNAVIDVDITMERPAAPDPGDSDVDGNINQVLKESFPSVVVFELFHDQDGNPITDLNASNFRVTEDGQPCVVTDVRTASQAQTPISVSLVLDRSPSMSGSNEELEAAASEFVNLMGSQDQGEIVNFASDISVDQTFTTDKQLLQNAIDNWDYLGGWTSLHDAVAVGAEDAYHVGGRSAVVAMTDGEENESDNYPYLSDLLPFLRGLGVPVFCVGLDSADEDALEQIASETGGLYHYAPDASQLQDIYEAVSGQLEGQTQIFFISPDPTVSGRTRTVEVTLINYGGFSFTRTIDYTM